MKSDVTWREGRETRVCVCGGGCSLIKASLGSRLYHARPMSHTYSLLGLPLYREEAEVQGHEKGKTSKNKTYCHSCPFSSSNTFYSLNI